MWPQGLCGNKHSEVGQTMVKGFWAALLSALVLFGSAHAPVQADFPRIDERKLAEELGAAFINVAEAVSPSVVSIQVEVKRQRANFGIPFFSAPDQGGIMRGGGSGVVLSKDGYILTNNHVIERADRIEVRLRSGKTFSASLVGADPATDLAVLKIKAKGLVPAKFASSDKARVGQWVVAIGSPFGLDYTVTTGVLSAKGRGGLGANEIEDYLQTDASINPGNSGGPLVDLRGQVLGINTMIIGRGTGIGFAIPAELAQSVAKQIRNQGSVRRAWLGVGFQDLTPELAGHFGQKEHGGALVSSVVAGGPADKAGVKSGDIIVDVGGTRIVEGRDLLRAVLRQQVGDKVPIQVQRDSKTTSLTVVAGERPSEQQSAASGSSAPSQVDSLGLGLRVMTPEIRRQLGYEGAGSVVVESVTPGSNADRAGLRRGDVIVEADRASVRSLVDVRNALKDGSALLRIERGAYQQYIVLETKPN